MNIFVLKAKARIALVILFALTFPFCAVSAADSAPMLIKAMPQETSHDLRHGYKINILKAALEATTEQYGPYKLEFPPYIMNSARAFHELQSNTGRVNTILGLTNVEREQESIAIPIPVRRGLLNYRLLLAQNSNLDNFKNIKTVEQLKNKTVGLGTGWLTSDIMARQGYTIALGTHRDSLFKMLAHGRFDYMLLGVNEIFQEIDEHALAELKLDIVPNLVVYINIPLFIFVSKTEPLIAERLQAGLIKLIKSGEFQMIFEQEYGDSIKRAALSGRHIITVENPTLPESVKHIKPEYWLDIK